jgi:hypothetical protein
MVDVLDFENTGKNPRALKFISDPNSAPKVREPYR